MIDILAFCCLQPYFEVLHNLNKLYHYALLLSDWSGGAVTGLQPTHTHTHTHAGMSAQTHTHEPYAVFQNSFAYPSCYCCVYCSLSAGFDLKFYGDFFFTFIWNTTKNQSTTCQQHNYTSSEMLVSVLLLYKHSKKKSFKKRTWQLKAPHIYTVIYWCTALQKWPLTWWSNSWCI